jgi:hypothetical protein
MVVLSSQNGVGLNADRNPGCKPLDWCPMLYEAALIIAYTGRQNSSFGLRNMWI